MWHNMITYLQVITLEKDNETLAKDQWRFAMNPGS